MPEIRSAAAVRLHNTVVITEQRTDKKEPLNQCEGSFLIVLFTVPLMAGSESFQDPYPDFADFPVLPAQVQVLVQASLES